MRLPIVLKTKKAAESYLCVYVKSEGIDVVKEAGASLTDMRVKVTLALISCFKLVSSRTAFVWPYITLKSVVLVCIDKLISKYRF